MATKNDEKIYLLTIPSLLLAGAAQEDLISHSSDEVFLG